MTEGTDWSQPPFVKKVYRWPFWKTFLWFAPVLMIVSLLSLVTLRGYDITSLPTDELLRRLMTSVIYALVLSLVNYFAWSIVLTPHSIGATSGMRTFRFENIEKVSRPWHGLGLLIMIKQKEAWMKLAIPVFLDDMDDFVRTVEQVVPENNPLRQYFCSLER